MDTRGRGVIAASSVGAGLALALLSGWSGVLVAEHNVAADEANHPQVAVERVAGRFAVEVNDLSLEDLLRALAVGESFEVSLPGRLDRRVTGRFEAASLAELLADLVAPNATAMVHDEPDARGERRLRRVVVLASGSTGRTRKARPGATPPSRPGGSLEELATALASEDAQARLDAIELLRRVSRPGGARLLHDSVVEDPVPEVRRAALRALGASYQDDAVSTARRAAHDRSPLVRHEAVRTLARDGSPASDELLTDLALRHPSAQTRLWALRTLSSHGTLDPGALLDRAAADPDARVRAIAVHALGEGW